MYKKRFLISTTILAAMIQSGDIQNVYATEPNQSESNVKVEDLNIKLKDATEQEEQIKKSESEINDYQSELDKKLAELAELEKQNNDLQYEINVLQEQIDTVTAEINTLEEKIAKKEHQMAETQIKMDAKKVIVARNLKIMEQKGDMPFLEYLLSSNSFSEIYSRYQVLSVVQEEHNARMKELNDLKKKIAEQKSIISSQRNSIETKRTALKINQNSIKEKQAIVDQQKQQIDNEYVQIEQNINQNKEIIRQMIQEIQNIEAENKNKTDKALQAAREKERAEQAKKEAYYNSEITGTDIVDIAYQWVYKRGLGSPNPVIYSMDRRQLTLDTYGDCSAFTRRVYMDAGYGHIGYTTADQIANPEGDFIERVIDLEPGDLMYFGPTGSHAVSSYLPDGRRVTTAHTAIYVGNNKMIDLASGVGTISVKDFGPGSTWEWYVNNRWVGGKRFYKYVPVEEVPPAEATTPAEPQ